MTTRRATNTEPAGEAATAAPPPRRSAAPAAAMLRTVEPGGGQFRRQTRRRLAYADTLILGLAIGGVLVIVWQLSQGVENLNDGLVSLVTASLTAAVYNARTSREYYFGAAAPEQEGDS